MAVLPSGTLPQLMYMRERLGHIKPGRFIEIDPGSGEITRPLLDLGWTRQPFDLKAATIERLHMRFAKGYRARSILGCQRGLSVPAAAAEIVGSGDFLYGHGTSGGCFGVCIYEEIIRDDDSRGAHDRSGIRELLAKNECQIGHLAGLPFPVSGTLLPVSNYLVGLSKTSKLKLSQLDRTKQSGRRSVKFKTHSPLVFELLFNRYFVAMASAVEDFCGL